MRRLLLVLLVGLLVALAGCAANDNADDTGDDLGDDADGVAEPDDEDDTGDSDQTDNADHDDDPDRHTDDDPPPVNETELSELNERIEELEAELSEREDRIAELEERLTERDEDISELEVALEERNTSINTLQAENDELQADLAELRGETDELESEIESLEAALTDRETEIDDLEAQVSDLEDELAQRDHQIEQLEATLNERDDRIAELEELLDDRNATIESLKEEIQELEEELDELRDENSADGELKLHHIDVGQADATLIVTPDGETILIDTGDWRQDGSEVIAYLEAQGIDRIDHLIATHAHADHIGGHAAVIEWAETEGDGIGTAYDSGVPHTTQTYDDYLDAIEEHDVELLFVEEGDELPLESDDLTGLFLNPPEGDSGDDLHYNSVSIVFEFGEFRYLTTGDAEADAEERMVDDWIDELPADVYQAGHHGSSTSSTQAFLEGVEPGYAVISSDLDSQYGHPHDEVLERFDDFEVETYWTGVHGDIVVTTDGDTLDVSTSEEYSTDPIDLLEAKPNDEDDEDDKDENDEEDTVADNIAVADLSVEGVSAEEEYIVLENTGDDSLDLGSWQIRDREDGGQVDRGLSAFTFPSDFELSPGDRVTIWTGDGDNTDTDLYWGYGVNMWRGEGDVIILMNPDGEHVFEHPYGDQA